MWTRLIEFSASVSGQSNRCTAKREGTGSVLCDIIELPREYFAKSISSICRRFDQFIFDPHVDVRVWCCDDRSFDCPDQWQFKPCPFLSMTNNRNLIKKPKVIFAFFIIHSTTGSVVRWWKSNRHPSKWHHRQRSRVLPSCHPNRCHINRRRPKRHASISKQRPCQPHTIWPNTTLSMKR